jgi:hypothetical protein
MLQVWLPPRLDTHHGIIAPQSLETIGLAMIEYKGYFISGAAVMIHSHSPDWRAAGTVYSKTAATYVIEAERIGGPVFTTKGAAERHGLELCQEWVDETLSARSSVSSAIVTNPA